MPPSNRALVEPRIIGYPEKIPVHFQVNELKFRRRTFPVEAGANAAAEPTREAIRADFIMVL